MPPALPNDIISGPAVLTRPLTTAGCTAATTGAKLAGASASTLTGSASARPSGNTGCAASPPLSPRATPPASSRARRAPRNEEACVFGSFMVRVSTDWPFKVRTAIHSEGAAAGAATRQPPGASTGRPRGDHGSNDADRPQYGDRRLTGRCRVD